jgi:hypothetical protein
MIGRMLYGASAVALITTTAVMAEPSGTNSKGDTTKQICRTIADTGTRLGRTRECHTEAEWAELRRQSGQDLDQYRASQSNGGH